MGSYLSRRDFLKLGAAEAAAAAALTACGPTRPEGGPLYPATETPFPQELYQPQLEWVQKNIQEFRPATLEERTRVFYPPEPENNFPHLTLQTMDREGGLGRVLSLDNGRFEFTPKDNIGGFKYLFLSQEMKDAYSQSYPDDPNNPLKEKILLAEEGLVHTWEINGQEFAEILTKEEINEGLERNGGRWDENLYEQVQDVKLERFITLQREIELRQENLLIDPTTAIVLTIAGRAGQKMLTPMFEPGILEQIAIKNSKLARELAELVIVNAASSLNLSREALLRKLGFTALCVSTCADSRVAMSLPTTIMVEKPPDYYLGKRVVAQIPGMAEALEEMRLTGKTHLAIEIQASLGAGLGNFNPADETVRSILILTHEGVPCSGLGCGALGALNEGRTYLEHHGVSAELIDFLEKAHTTPIVDDDTTALARLAAEFYNEARAKAWGGIHPERFDAQGNLLPKWRITVTGAIYPHQGGEPARIQGNFNHSGLDGPLNTVIDLGTDATPLETKTFIKQAYLLQQKLGPAGEGQNPVITFLDFTKNGSTALGGPLEPGTVMRLTPPEEGIDGLRKVLIEAEYPTQHFTNNRIMLVAVDSEEMAQKTAQAILEGGIPKWDSWLQTHGSDARLIITVADDGQPFRRALVMTGDALLQTQTRMSDAVSNLAVMRSLDLTQPGVYEQALKILRESPPEGLDQALVRPDLVDEITQGGTVRVALPEKDIALAAGKLDDAVRAGVIIPERADRLSQILNSRIAKTTLLTGAVALEIAGWVGDIMMIYQLLEYAKVDLFNVTPKVRLGYTSWNLEAGSPRGMGKFVASLEKNFGPEAANAFTNAGLNFGGETTADSFLSPPLSKLVDQLGTVLADQESIIRNSYTRSVSGSGGLTNPEVNAMFEAWRADALRRTALTMVLFNEEDGGVSRYVPLYEMESANARDLPVGILIPLYRDGFDPAAVTTDWQETVAANLEGLLLQAADGSIVHIVYNQNTKSWTMGDVRFNTARQRNDDPNTYVPVRLAMRIVEDKDGNSRFQIENVTGLEPDLTIEEKQDELKTAYPEVVWPW